MIEAKKVVKHFGLKPVLRGVDFRVEEGEFVALVSLPEWRIPDLF